MKLRLASLFTIISLVAACGAGSRPADDDVIGDDDNNMQCTPGENTCSGNEVHSCNADGTIGGLVQACNTGETCSGGACVTGGSCGAQGVELIYVVDKDNGFYSFDPANDANTFTRIGTLNCPNPGVDLRDGSSTATPFSMSVDRSGVAWVLYASGKIFKVSTQDASCTESSWTVGSNGFELFGMGFVSDSMGSNTEHLWISGGLASAMSNMDGNSTLGDIDPSNNSVQTVGALYSNGEYSPELTGTGAGELWGYYPGSSTMVARLSKTTPGSTEMNYPMPDLGVDNVFTVVEAWAFAHWGGRFYVFVTIGDALGGTEDARVYRLDPNALPAQQLSIPNIPVIVGAGVSTCAPITIE